MLPMFMFMLYTQIIYLECLKCLERIKDYDFGFLDSVPIMMLMRQLESLCGLASACPNEKAKATLLGTHCQSMVGQMKGLALTHDGEKARPIAWKRSRQ